MLPTIFADFGHQIIVGFVEFEVFVVGCVAVVGRDHIAFIPAKKPTFQEKAERQQVFLKKDLAGSGEIWQNLEISIA
jgi:hypothetical protein